MKKSWVVTISIVMIFVIGIVYYKYISDFSSLGTIKQNIISKNSNASEVTFYTEEEGVKVNINSSVEEGNLKFTLVNSSGEIIETFESNKKYLEEIDLDKNEEYKISAIYENFIGEFNVKIY